MHHPTPTAIHAHAVGLDACTALINTLELDGNEGLPDDHIPTVEDALAFFARHDLGHVADLRRQAGRDGDAWMDRIRQARAALRELWDAQVEERAPGDEALEILNGILDRGPRVELRATAAGVAIDHRHPNDDPTSEVLARLTAPLVETIAAGDTLRFRICANDGCRWVFEDASRAGRRRWCDMATCGNRDKVRRFRSRRRDDATPDQPPAG
jgi:predicted RNA-binding Zn ribbon-like protein